MPEEQKPVKSAGFVVVDRSSPPKYLFLRSYSYWDFPKGKVDFGESDWETAIRETFEESGLDRLDFAWGKLFKETKPYATKVDGKKRKKVSKYFVAGYVGGEISLQPNPESGIIEHEEFKWATYKEAADMPLHERIRAVLDWANDIVTGESVD